jgi:hypothetical protein
MLRNNGKLCSDVAEQTRVIGTLSNRFVFHK